MGDLIAGLMLLAVVVVALKAVLGGTASREAAGKLDGIECDRKLLFDHKTERELYARLVQALPGFIVAPQVSMLALVKPRGRKAMRLRGLIGQSRVDFVVAEAGGKVVGVVELDGSSHDTDDGARRDAVKNGVLAIAGIRIVRYRSNAMPTVEELKAALGVEVARTGGSIRG